MSRVAEEVSKNRAARGEGAEEREGGGISSSKEAHVNQATTIYDSGDMVRR